MLLLAIALLTFASTVSAQFDIVSVPFANSSLQTPNLVVATFGPEIASTQEICESLCSQFVSSCSLWLYRPQLESGNVCILMGNRDDTPVTVSVLNFFFFF
jgi:hypothetical protein